MSAIPTPLQDCSQSTGGSNTTREEERHNQERTNQTSLFADDMFYVRDPEFSTRELEMKHHVIKMTRYTVNFRNSRGCPRTNHKHREGHREQTPFGNNLKTFKYLGINLTQEGKDLYKENFKFLKRELVTDTRKQKDVPCSRISRIIHEYDGSTQRHD